MSIFQRKVDLLYLVFFILHIPVMFFVDLAPIYPDSIRPQFITDLRLWYITTYNDRFFTKPTAWFTLYMWLELFYHLPVSIWAIGALLRDDAKVPLHLLIFGLETAITTATCVAEYLSWTGYSVAEKIELGKLYVPYLMLSVFMSLDMFQRLNRALSNRQTTIEVKKVQ